MNSQTQACRLTQMMQASKHYKCYELTLPLVMVESKALQNIVIDDVWLLNLETFSVLVLDEERVIAELRLTSIGESYRFDVVKLVENNVEHIKLSFGMIAREKLTLDTHIEVQDIDFQKVHIIDRKTVIAEASLVTVSHKIAVKIDKVIK
jgi:hypothetical protein